MSTRFGLDVRGIAQTYAALREAAMTTAQRREVLDGLRRGGEVIAGLARRGVRVRSGDLLESISVGDATVGVNRISVKIYAARPKGSHGLVVERGHMARGGKGRVRAYPYLAPALEDGREAALNEVAEGVSAALKRSVSK